MNIKKFPLHDIKFVLLDMDGTLLDKYFDDFFWEHREGINFIGRIFCRYLRLQCKTDHAMNDDKTYAIKMYNKALKGKSPWARCNYNGTYQEMDPGFPVKYQWLRTVDKDVLFRFVQEMAQKEPLPESFR